MRIAPTELTQVLINLLANGAQAVAARGITTGWARDGITRPVVGDRNRTADRDRAAGREREREPEH